MNKNTKRKNLERRKALKAQKQSGESHVVSSNNKRNMRMKILINQDGKGNKTSMTVHELINRKEPFIPYKNKNYGKKPIWIMGDEEEVSGFEKIPKSKPTKI